MKGLDTPALLSILRGGPAAKTLLRSLHGEELATTEISMFELETIARLDPRPGKERRVAALDRLRRRLTVLPVDAKAAKWAGVQAAARPGAASPLTWLVMGAFETSGCTDWVTDRPVAGPQSAGNLRTTALGRRNSKTR